MLYVHHYITLNISPGVLVFHRDMLLNIPVLAHLALIRNHCQVLIDENLWQQNLKRHQFYYQVGQKVLFLNSRLKLDKLEPRANEGPFNIVQVHAKGTITIQCDELVTEQINIHHVHPYREHQ